MPGQLRSLGSDGPPRGRTTARSRPSGGVQLFLPEAVELEGPLSIVGSPWRLTIREQRAFAPRPPRSSQDGFGSVLHVVIGTWDTPSSRGVVPSDCDGRSLTREIWSQMKESDALKMGRARHPRPPLWFSLDGAIGVGANGRVRPGPDLLRGAAVDEWSSRPGPALEEPVVEAREGDGLWRSMRGGTWMHWDRLVFAGEHLKTLTRLDSAEGACESGRHAANAIILHAARRRSARGRAGKSRQAPPGGLPELAPTWNPERLGGLDLEWLRDLDDGFIRERLPHLFEIAGIDAWVSLVSWISAFSPASEGVLRTILERLRKAANGWAANGRDAPRGVTTPTANTTTYQEAVLDVLRRIRDSLEAHSRREPAS